MFCKNCGKEIDKESKFCAYCGADVRQKETEPSKTVSETAAAAAPADKPPKVWTVFSKVSKILGIVCLSTSIIPFLNYVSLALGIVGIVMSRLGLKAKTAATDKDCDLGFKLSIAAVVVSFIMVIVFYIMLISLLEDIAWGIYNYYYFVTPLV
ncbi:MAG: zinc ribbon domain-containing protein [Clostridiales bacterium]|nr:zinc ribbon domain-containing protein [Clostridiales bacterium]